MMRIRRPSVFAVLLTIGGVVAFSALGVWQLRRAAWKETVLARFARAADAPVVSLADAAANREPGAYPHVRVTGRIEGNRVYLLDDQILTGKLGVMVFAPFRPRASGKVLLADLGFLQKMGPDSTQLPDLPPMPEGTVTLTGIYAPPPLPGLKLGGNPLVREKTWPKLVTWIDTREIAADLDSTVYPHVLLLDPDPHAAYTRIWTANVMPPERHRAYALQWFSFAAAAIVLFFVLHRAERGGASNPGRE
jgi:surfeit locus 1 family protein